MICFAKRDSRSRLAERLCNILDLTPLDDYHNTASFGVSAFRNGDGAKSFIDRADVALYKAKSNGRNRVEDP